MSNSHYFYWSKHMFTDHFWTPLGLPLTQVHWPLLNSPGTSPDTGSLNTPELPWDFPRHRFTDHSWTPLGLTLTQVQWPLLNSPGTSPDTFYNIHQPLHYTNFQYNGAFKLHLGIIWLSNIITTLKKNERKTWGFIGKLTVLGLNCILKSSSVDLWQYFSPS